MNLNLNFYFSLIIDYYVSHFFFIVCYLQLLALNEGAIMSKNEIETFLHPFKPDIRQSILQLQFILNTGKLNEVLFLFFYSERSKEGIDFSKLFFCKQYYEK